ncbi:MAG: FkbM family methyltransferase [Helicobacter sp.]|nr:FkbM family methyltransferase [Helicobacter sp.]
MKCLDLIYKFYRPLEVSRQYSVIDIGANVGYTALYFAQQSWCKQVLSFELFPQNIRAMQENLVLNSPSIQQKVILYPYGLGKKENIKSGGGIMASYFEHRDGISSMNKDFVRNYAPEEESKEIITRCEIRSASETLKRLVDDYKLTNIIVKIDVEGAEYEIFEDLAMHYPEFFQKVVKIVGDTHLGFDRFMDIIKPFGFEVVFKEPHADLTCPFELERICK